MTLGRLVYLSYYKPLGLVRQSIREGGPINQLITLRGRIAMEKAALELPPTASDRTETSVQVHMLTGRKFWYQSAFCVRSLIGHSLETNIQPVFYDDGTLNDSRKHLERIFPSAIFVTFSECKARLDRFLPESKFPNLCERWRSYPNIRKLIDPHLGSFGWKLVLDSDILFFRTPLLLLKWLQGGDRPIYMVDAKESYGYSRVHLANLAQARPPECLNVGLCGLRSDALDWEQLESWATQLITTKGTHYLLEQALVAMLVSAQECIVAPALDYITWPSHEEVLKPSAVMHHYVAESKVGYFRYGWKACLSRILHGCSGR
jgi:hypothetical protein